MPKQILLSQFFFVVCWTVILSTDLQLFINRKLKTATVTPDVPSYIQLFSINLLALRTFGTETFCTYTFGRCNIFPLKKKNLAVLYETRAIFSYEIFCRNFFYYRLTCFTWFYDCIFPGLIPKIQPRKKTQKTHCKKRSQTVFFLGFSFFFSQIKASHWSISLLRMGSS